MSQNFTVIVSKMRVLGQKTTGGRQTPPAPPACLGSKEPLTIDLFQYVVGFSIKVLLKI